MPLLSLFLPILPRACALPNFSWTRPIPIIPRPSRASASCPCQPWARCCSVAPPQSIQSELDEFFAHLNQQAQLVRKVSEQAFAQARAKLSLTAIPMLNDWLIERAEHYDFVVAPAKFILQNPAHRVWPKFGFLTAPEPWIKSLKHQVPTRA